MNKPTVFAVQVVRIWLPLAFLATALCGLAYVTSQQVYRQGANDPQIQMAEDAATQLATGIDPHALISPDLRAVDIAQSLAPYMAVYDASGTPVVSNGILNGAAPMPPAGVFDWIREYGEARVTWQPQPGVRSAIIVVHYDGPKPGYVLAGRSLREVERREEQLSKMVAVVWFCTLVGLLVLVALSQWMRAYLKKHHDA